MIVVADSGPLHYLVLLNLADLLPLFYGDVLIPPAVLHELSCASVPAGVSDWLAEPPNWLQLQRVKREQVQSVTADLDLGEREAIALAEVVHADLLLIDDSAGRAEARRRNIRITGTLGVLRAAAERKLIDVPIVLTKLRDTSFYFDEELIRTIFGTWLRGQI